jgi:hypothetical protein
MMCVCANFNDDYSQTWRCLGSMHIFKVPSPDIAGTVMPTRSASILNSVLFCIADGVLCRVLFCAVAGAVAGARCPSAILEIAVVVAAVAASGDITLTMLRV